MTTIYSEIKDLDHERAAFFEVLTQQFIAVTGCGVYVYLNPVAVNGLFDQYLSCDTPIQMFVRKCVKNVLN